MTHQRLPNYLKTYRKRAGLSQEELAYVLGLSGGDKVSRLERRSRVPSLETLLAYEAAFGVPARELVAGLYEKVEEETRRRAKALARRLEQGEEGPWTERKLESLRAAAGQAVSQTHDETQEEAA